MILSTFWPVFLDRVTTTCGFKQRMPAYKKYDYSAILLVPPSAQINELTLSQGTHCTGETGKMAKKNPCQGVHREFGNFVKTLGKCREFCLNTGKTQGILLAQVVNVLILKVKDIAIVAAKKSIFFQKLDRSANSVLCM